MGCVGRRGERLFRKFQIEQAAVVGEQLDSGLAKHGVGSHLGLRISNFAPKKPSNVRICLVDILTFDGLVSSLELQPGYLA
jgi:hypothetical protein